MKITRKELDKEINNSLKTIMKKYGYKKRSCVLFKKRGNYFITILIAATGINNNKICIREGIKPYFIDDLFWKVFHMPENSNEPMGLRANGAFAVNCLEINVQHREVSQYDEVYNFVDELVNNANAEIEALLDNLGEDVQAFRKYSLSVDKAGLYDPVLSEMLFRINDEDYTSARELAIEEIKNYRYGHFGNEGKYIYHHVVDYCDKYLGGNYE
ncbi:MAG: hypothetical protein RR585_06820 [Coprobacillus sp.]